MFSLFDNGFLRYFRFVRFILPLRRLYYCNYTSKNKKNGKSHHYYGRENFQEKNPGLFSIRGLQTIITEPNSNGENTIQQPENKKGEVVANLNFEQKRENHTYTSEKENRLIPNISIKRRITVVHIKNLSVAKRGVFAVC